MGVLAPIGAAIGGALGIGGGYAATTAALAGTAGTVGAASAVGAGLSIGAGLTAASTILSGAVAAKSLLTGAPKPPALAPPTQSANTPPQLGASQTKPIQSSKNSSLAALAPGLALGGTGGFLGAALGGQRKTLLGQ